MRNDLSNIIFRVLTTVVLLLLGSGTLYYNWLQRSVCFVNYTYSTKEAEKLKKYPKAQYAHGLNAWARQDFDAAKRFFQQAVSNDVLFFDGWMKLAEVEAAMGRKEIAKLILEFSIDRTKRVSRWKWTQMLLASEIGMDEVIYSNANYLLSHGILEQDTFQFLQTFLSGNTSAVIAIIDPHHLDIYLEWLMNWSMAEESLTVWRAMTKVSVPQKETALRYAHFLLHSKQIVESKKIWQQQTGETDLTNPGFETEITGIGFDWCYLKEKGGKFEVMRVKNDTWEGDYALRIDFNGHENIFFHHLYQIFTINPQTKYRLTYAWKSQGITTDQGLFFEIYGYDQEDVNFYWDGPMILGTHEWRMESIEFEIPEGCRAAVLRLRRQPSNRFDSKIRGTLWIDDFKVEKIEKDTQRFSREKGSALVSQSSMRNGNFYLSTR